MEYNLVNHLQTCYDFVQKNPQILFYSHIPSSLVALIVGIFIFFKKRNNLQSKLIVLVSISFSVWVALNLLVWNSYSSGLIMISWATLGILSTLFFSGCFYLLYIFDSDKDLPFILKVAMFILFLPIIFLMATKINLTGFNFDNCEAVESNFIINYNFSVQIILSVASLVVAIIRIKKNSGIARKKIILMSIGVLFFLGSFFISGYISQKLDNFKLEQYGLFSMTVFMMFLAYLIVRYKAFNIKLLGAQALVVGLVILIGSQFFFIQNNTNRILTGITLALAIGAGYVLIKSVKAEVERKEQLQMMSNKLAQANDQLRKLDNAKTEFISIASHQLRTPLTAIKGFLSLMLEGSYGKLQKKHEEVLNKVYISNERLINLVEDLLNISRIESGRMEFTFQKWDIAKICSELVDTFILKAKDRGLYLHYKKPEHPLPEATTDGAKLREVISNIIDNALKYSQRGGVMIRLSQGGDNIQIAVSDTGIGIPQEELPYLFSKFSRGKDVNRLSVGGTGLGLYVGKSIMEAVGGRIWAESEGAGKGSRFIVEVPVEHSL